MSGVQHRAQMATRLGLRNRATYRGREVDDRHVTKTQEAVNSGLRGSLELLGTVITPITLFTALGLYIGWRRTASYAQYFGIDQSVLQYNTQDYLLRSWQSANRVIFTVVLGSLVATLFHLWVKQLMQFEQHRWARTLALISYIITGLSGVVLIVLAISAIVSPIDKGVSGVLYSLPYITNYALIAFAAALLLYFGSLALRLRSLQQQVSIFQSAANTRIIATLVMALLFLGVLSASDKYVSLLGSVDAEYMAATLSKRQGVIVYSKEDLALPKEVSRTELTGNNQAYHYRYEGLRLYIRSADRYFLLPATWSKIDADSARAARLIVLRDDPSLRFEFAPGLK